MKNQLLSLALGTLSRVLHFHNRYFNHLHSNKDYLELHRLSLSQRDLVLYFLLRTHLLRHLFLLVEEAISEVRRIKDYLEYQLSLGLKMLSSQQ